MPGHTDDADFTVLAVPSQTLRGNLAEWVPLLADAHLAGRSVDVHTANAAARPIVTRVVCSVRSREMAADNPSGERGGTITPVSSSSCSRIPPTSVATTGVPQHIASKTTVERHSPRLGTARMAARW